MSSVSRHAPRVTTRPIPIKRALPFVRSVHRRLPKCQGAMWAVAALIAGEVVGVAVVGHAQARMADNPGPRESLEVTRVAVIEGAKNACSALYAACARAARGMGAQDMWTSVHEDESGHSLHAAGWVRIGPCGGGSGHVRSALAVPSSMSNQRSSGRSRGAPSRKVLHER